MLSTSSARHVLEYRQRRLQLSRVLEPSPFLTATAPFIGIVALYSSIAMLLIVWSSNILGWVLYLINYHSIRRLYRLCFLPPLQRSSCRGKRMSSMSSFYHNNIAESFIWDLVYLVLFAYFAFDQLGFVNCNSAILNLHNCGRFCAMALGRCR